MRQLLCMELAEIPRLGLKDGGALQKTAAAAQALGIRAVKCVVAAFHFRVSRRSVRVNPMDRVSFRCEPADATARERKARQRIGPIKE
jgi:hypothetical protein